MTEISGKGKSSIRLDALDKVTGRAKYCPDIKIPGMLYGKILRSKYSHAKIVSIDTSKAEKIPGVRCVITGKDVPEKRFGASVYDQHIMARDVVRYIGDPVAAIAADNIATAENALSSIDVKYSVLPGIYDIEEAWKKETPVILHPKLSEYTLGKTPPPKLVPERPNVCNYRTLRHGDVEAGFDSSDIIIENRFTTTRLQHCPLEQHNCIAQVESDGSLTIWAGRQSIFLAKEYLCKAFGLPPSKVRVIVSHYIGGGFGSKVTLYTEPIAVILASKTKRAVNVSFNREEMFSSGGTRVPFVIDIKDGIKNDGTLMARQMRMLLGMGAYSGSGPLITRNSVYGIAAAYRIPNVKVDAYAVYTNEPIITSFRGFGTSQPLWAIESQMDIIAKKLKIDPAEIRNKNILNPGEINATGEIVHSIGLKECLEKVTDYLDWNKKIKQEETWKRGKGLALGNKYSMAPTTATARVKVLPDGVIELYESADEMGQGCITVLAQIVAEEFKVSLDKVKVKWGDTDITPYFSRGSTSQRTTFNLGKAVRAACEDAKRQCFEIAADILQVAVCDLETQNGNIYYKSNTRKTIPITKLFTAERELLSDELGNYVDKYSEIIGKGICVTKAAPSDPYTAQIPVDIAKKGGRVVGFYGYAAQAAEVLVNIETGEVKIDKFGAASDVGYALNPKMCEQQIEGGAGMGLGSALWEDVMLNEGEVLNPNFRDYQLIKAGDMPELSKFKVFIVESAHKDGPYGAKGTGETTMTPTAPAIANAIYDAVGVRIKDLPITREKILMAIKKKA